MDENKIPITFSTCYYNLHSKFNQSKYAEWINNLVSIVDHFYLVIYTDTNGIEYIDTKNNPKIKVIIKLIDQFYNYQYKDFWIENHSNNHLLNKISGWELNMLWAEKIYFVKETIEQEYFDTEYHGWCDIGYFRNTDRDTNTNMLKRWPCPSKIRDLEHSKIVYGWVNNDTTYTQELIEIIQDKDTNLLSKRPIPQNQISVAGGFFILHKTMICQWASMFNDKLTAYIQHKRLVKDDQMIIVDCIISNPEYFTLFKENHKHLDNWFMFQRILMSIL